MAIASPLAQPTASPAPVVVYKANEWGMKLVQAKDLKVFVLEALKHPEQGGAFYAHEALRQCEGWQGFTDRTDASIQKIIAAKSTISAEQLAQMKEVETLCSGLLGPDLDALRDETYRIALTGADPLMKVAMGSGPKHREDIVATGNLALMSANETPFRMMSGLRSDAGTNFNGHLYGADEEPALDAAIQLSTCVEGDYCRLESQRHGMCWYQGKCYSTREEMVKYERLKGDQAQLDKAIQIADRMRAALARGDASIFH